jgi:succinate-semialdehyde dehydrogenase/glutarate-semialdehyde dehydrogenase
MTALSRDASNGREQMTVVNPATLEELERVPLMTSDEIKAAVGRAERMFPLWRDLPVRERAKYVLRARDYMLEHVDDVARVITLEMGKPKVEALVNEVMVSADLMDHYARRAEEILDDQPIPLHLFKVVRQSYVRYEPFGVVSVISPWNYPLSIPMSSIVFALLAGNTVVFKPASDAVLIARKIEEIFKAGGLPEGVLNLVIAAGETLGTALYEPPVRKVAFTGSTGTGVAILREASKHLIPVTLELGGKDAMIVLPDADLERAAAGAVWGAFFNAGQTCASVERCYVHRSVYDRFVALVTEQTRQLRVGPGSEPDVDVGPMTNAKQLEVVEEHVRDAIERGATAVVGGSRLDRLKGTFFAPTVLTGVTQDMRCMREETFGPTLPIMPFDTEDEVVALANDSEYGLTASVWSRDRERAERMAARLEAGTVSINDHASSFGLPETPWQGVKKSGIGVTHGDEGLRAFAIAKHVAVDRIPLTTQPWWFPYSAVKYEAFKSGIKMVLGGRGMGSVFDGLRSAIASLGSGDVHARAWQQVRSSIHGAAGACVEEEPPEGIWRSILWASKPCDPQAEPRANG